ncbi:hypothetical protein EPUS_00502 [Endocarpon pusillum Z07020]|uniref:Uncharacterized protein n=1 Tax=Endocarpon pusillum (strain Z07020 / HMAS-L-300199) TaxID=1263415 RepID=U1GHB4_ENDPU|nr:uncharacterized protein EPUS_00502 [Endocarpon pusillum Z07020]ERF71513.1 hypothetical protein EPUS_00502 [Endocarpon pusillum Z07020]
MIFLPSAAIATIFSMSSSFDKSHQNELLVSSEFWIFWSVAIPLTAVVLVIYALWAQRAGVRAWLAEKRRKRYLKQQKRLGSDKKPMGKGSRQG